MTESVRAKLGVMKKALLKKRGHPPDKQAQTNKTTRPQDRSEAGGPTMRHLGFVH